MLHIKLVASAENLTIELMMPTLARLAQKYGGLNVTQGLGLWAENGDLFLENYDNINREPSFTVELTVSENDYNPDFIKRAFLATRKYGVNWVHQEIYSVATSHFSIAEFLAEKATMAEPLPVAA